MVKLATEIEEECIKRLGEIEYVRQLEHVAEHGRQPRGTVQDVIEATDSLGRLGAFDSLIRLSRSDYVFTCECAVEALGTFGDASVLPALVLASETDKDQRVREKASKAIGQIGLVLRETAELLKKDGKTAAADIEAAARKSREVKRQQAQPRVCIRIGGL